MWIFLVLGVAAGIAALGRETILRQTSPERRATEPECCAGKTQEEFIYDAAFRMRPPAYHKNASGEFDPSVKELTQ